MKGPLVMALCTLAIIIAALAFDDGAPRCDATSPHGPRIGGTILIAGCP